MLAAPVGRGEGCGGVLRGNLTSCTALKIGGQVAKGCFKYLDGGKNGRATVRTISRTALRSGSLTPLAKSLATVAREPPYPAATKAT